MWNTETNMTALPLAIAAADVNHNGKLDLVVSTGIAVFLGNGDGTFQAVQRFGSLTGYSSLAIGDFNGDGYLDVAAIDGTNIWVFHNDKVW